MGNVGYYRLTRTRDTAVVVHFEANFLVVNVSKEKQNFQFVSLHMSVLFTNTFILA